jgi:hypothetical protein
MAKVTLREAMQDENYFFNFILNSPKHGMVLSLINGAVKLLCSQLGEAVRNTDVTSQRQLYTKSKFLCQEAHDRLHIRTQHCMAEAVEWIHGEAALAQLQAAQAQAIKDGIAKLRSERNVALSALERQFWDAGVYSARPTWDANNEKADTSLQCAVRTCRVEIFEATIAMNAAYACTRKNESWALKTQIERIRQQLAFFSDVESQTSMFKLIKVLYGADGRNEIVHVMESHSKIPALRLLRDQCQASQYSGPLYLTTRHKHLEPKVRTSQRKHVA